MRIDCGPTALALVDAKEKWHQWFAWYPVRVDDAAETCVWLEHVWRRGALDISWYSADWSWSYRLAKPL